MCVLNTTAMADSETVDPAMSDRTEVAVRDSVLLTPGHEHALSAALIYKAVLGAEAPEPPEYVTVQATAGSSDTGDRPPRNEEARLNLQARARIRAELLEAARKQAAQYHSSRS